MSEKFLEQRSFAGQVARAGESGIVSVSYVNKDDKPIKAGYFVARAEDGCKNVSAANDHILGVALATSVHHEFKAGTNLSAMTVPHGSEIWVQMTDSSTLAVGDQVKIVATGADAGKISETGEIATHFYVSGLNGKLAKIMRNEVVAAPTAP